MYDILYLIIIIYYLDALNHSKRYKLYVGHYFLFFIIFGVQSVSNKVVNFLEGIRVIFEDCSKGRGIA